MKRSEKILNLCKDINLTEGKLSKEYLFTIEMVDLFYFKGNIGQIDIKSGFTDGSNDGGIDFIYTDDETMYLIQGKSSESMSVEDIINVFYKMKNTVEDFEKENYSKYSRKLKSAFRNVYDSLDDNKNIEMVLFTNTKFNEQEQKKINERINHKDFSAYEITVFDIEDIEKKEVLSYQEYDLIKEASINLYLNSENTGNVLKYGENGLIVNVRASSIKHLYEQYSETGLFSYNLREHISQKNVDDAIELTIKKERENFWYYNNGITIGCKKFDHDGYRIKLFDFSIINGAQTTTNIGKSKLIDSKHDFPLVCKIVQSNIGENGGREFIGRISEASNSQKPIRFRDLKSNDFHQKNIYVNAAENKYPLAIEIKRGVKPQNYKKVEKWQRVTNEYVGQLVLACIFQKPGLARNSKNTIFSSKKMYQQVFVRKFDFNTLYDLVRLGSIYDEYASRIIKETNDVDKIGIMKNGKLAILSIVCYLIKKQKGIVEDHTSEAVYSDNLSGLLFTDYPHDDLEKKISEVFDFIIRRLKSLYDQKKEIEKLTSYSNYFKNERFYEMFLRDFDELDSYDTEKLSSYMKVFEEKNEL
jgi:hypothetical protein